MGSRPGASRRGEGASTSMSTGGTPLVIRYVPPRNTGACALVGPLSRRRCWRARRTCPMTATAPLPSPPAPRLVVLPSAPRGSVARGLVARARLVRRLLGVRDVSLMLLVAPAGYGKSTTLLEWAQRDERPFAWVALERADDDPDYLRGSLARAIDPMTGR